MSMQTAERSDAIDYDPPFAANVSGRLYARFHLGPNKAPEFEADRDGLRHYPIDLFLHSPHAAEIPEVQYVMDDPSYIDPVGRSTDRANDFREEIWSYGEVQILVRVTIGDRTFEQRVSHHDGLVPVRNTKLRSFASASAEV